MKVSGTAVLTALLVVFLSSMPSSQFMAFGVQFIPFVYFASLFQASVEYPTHEAFQVG